MRAARHDRVPIAGKNMQSRINVLSAILLLVWIAGLTGALAGDPTKLDEADRLFALAKSHWAASTSVYVEQLLQKALALREALLPEADPRVAQAEDQLRRRSLTYVCRLKFDALCCPPMPRYWRRV
jgi:hypothetical protein